jgi:hypothetical protein
MKSLKVPFAFLLLLVPFYTEAQMSTPEKFPASPSPVRATLSAEKQWAAFLQSGPYPFKPFPPSVSTLIDGTYVKLDPKKEPPIPCRRCPDYAPEGGRWWLNLDRGIFRVFHESTGWKSLGSFVVQGDRLNLFNDPCCHELTGIYEWKLEKDHFRLKVIEDDCAIRMRAENLTRQPWLSCPPPSAMGDRNHTQLSPPCP